MKCISYETSQSSLHEEEYILNISDVGILISVVSKNNLKLIQINCHLSLFVVSRVINKKVKLYVIDGYFKKSLNVVRKVKYLPQISNLSA